MFNKKLLLGVTESGELIFGNVEVRERCGVVEFSASFDTVYPTILTKELALDRIESYIECIDRDDLLYKLETFDCKPSKLAENLYEESHDVISDYFDNSLYHEVFTIDESDVFFESIGCGQHDTRKELKKLFVIEDVYNFIHELWDEYHLKFIPSDKALKLQSLIEDNEIEDEEEYIENWLKVTYFNEHTE